ncbi:uncharacterized protein LOC135462185 [Liolophura sinensis]|uniref:uncharacterized protein LOC135462185 n=1 Tax=Liolophura sinensis TaxID=3198878 RepID=UPI0031582888
MNDTALDNLRQQLTTLVVTDDVTEVINRSSGNDVTLHCPADKGSLATWYKGMSIPRKTVAASAPSPGSEFTIPSASESDSGIYVCDVIAENHGQVKRKLLYFAVSVTEAEGDGLQLSLIVSTAVILCVVLAVGVICYRRRKTRNTGRDDTSIRYQSSVSQTPDVCQYVKVGSNISPDESVVMETG